MISKEDTEHDAHGGCVQPPTRSHHPQTWLSSVPSIQKDIDEASRVCLLVSSARRVCHEDPRSDSVHACLQHRSCNDDPAPSSCRCLLASIWTSSRPTTDIKETFGLGEARANVANECVIELRLSEPSASLVISTRISTDILLSANLDLALFFNYDGAG